MNQNFDPIYASLASLLLTACTTSFTTTATAGQTALTGIPSTAALTPGLAVYGDPSIPTSDVIATVDSGSQVSLLAPATGGGALSLKAGVASWLNSTSARLLRHWADLGPEQFPALFVTPIRELSEKRIGQLNKWTLDVRVWLYTLAPDQNTPPTIAQNALLGAIRAAMGPDPSGPGRAQFRQTLGGLVFDAWIQGAIETDEGYLGQKAVAKIPITIIQNGP